MSLVRKTTYLMAAIVTIAVGIVLAVTNIYAAKLRAVLNESGIEVASSLTTMKWVVLLISLGILALSIAGIHGLLRKHLKHPFDKVLQAARGLSEGVTDFDVDQDLLKQQDEMGASYQALNKVRETMVEQTMVIELIANGETDVATRIGTQDNRMTAGLVKLIGQIEGVGQSMSQMAGNVRRGAIRRKVDVSKLEGAWRSYPETFSDAIGVIVKIFDSLPLIVSAFDKDYRIEFMNATGEKILGQSSEELSGSKCYDSFKTDQCNTDQCACRQCMSSGEVVRKETISRAGSAPMDIDYIGVPLEDESGNVLGAFEIVLDQTKIKSAQRVAGKQADYQSRQLSNLLSNIDKMSKGQLNIEAQVDDGDADTKILELTYKSISENLNNSVSAISSYIEEIASVLADVANKNLTVSIERDYLGDFKELKNSINHIVGVFKDTLEEIGEAAVQVEIGTNQVAESSQNLSQGSAEQASSVEEISATVSQIAEQTKQNALNANNANGISSGVKVDANQGNVKMRNMLKAMGEIKNSSNNINSIIKVIDDIAFQTNILALNAAVEAARAGEHGKGFAVVAEEVRNLAARSASAAKETTGMIDLSISKVNEGYALANETADALQKIVQGVEEIVDIVESISEASIQQATAVGQIDDGINQISQVTQMNTSTAEESASASEQMASQAHYLKAMINEFKLNG